jgi:imidazolonepropionase-like amidohydrolase
MEADLVILEDDPGKDITAFAKVRQVIRGGKVIYPVP